MLFTQSPVLHPCCSATFEPRVVSPRDSQIPALAGLTMMSYGLAHDRTRTRLRAILLEAACSLVAQASSRWSPQEGWARRRNSPLGSTTGWHALVVGWGTILYPRGFLSMVSPLPGRIRRRCPPRAPPIDHGFASRHDVGGLVPTCGPP